MIDRDFDVLYRVLADPGQLNQFRTDGIASAKSNNNGAKTGITLIFLFINYYLLKNRYLSGRR